MVRLLIRNKVHVNAKNTVNRTALHWAVAGGHENTVELLLGYSANVDIEDKHACIHLAVKHNFAQLIRLLIDARCDINIGDHVGSREHGLLYTLDPNAKPNWSEIRQQSALHLAVEQRQLVIVEMLLKANIDLQLQDKQGKTVLDLAVLSQRAAPVDIIIKTERFYTRSLNTEEVAAVGQGGTVLDFSFSCMQDLKHICSVLWILATKHLKPNDWKKLAEHCDFSRKHVKAIETQWTGSCSYKEHGYRMLLIWLHGIVTSGKHPIKELYESLVKTGNAELGDEYGQELF
ncbi:ankyrin repeat and death domain-containing protein 1A-like isoform X2 [Heptranchias perlo]|uniref:ankyrin repeat and death domain-containing protein 1A-like isoform X2 n=1 Tax=Heptranchias perlo TaxID=212740 RepID=UPI0035596A1A